MTQSRASGAQSPNHPEPAVRDAIQRALIALGHQIDADTVRFFRDPDKDTTALAQLCDSLEAAFLALLASPALPKGEGEEATRFPEYGSTDAGFVIAGASTTEGDKRLLALLVRALGSDHPAVDDLIALMFRARPAASMSPKSGEQA